MALETVLRGIGSWGWRRRRFRQRWNAGLPDELVFWDRFLGTRGAEWPEDYRARLAPETPFQVNLSRFLEDVPADTVRILDVGAGPLTKLGKTHQTKCLDIVATDPLAAHYDRLLAKYQIEPVVRTIAVAAEELSSHFPRDTFDFATAFNCLDHAYDPLQAMREMIAVVKPSRYAYLAHSENEAEKQNWSGLHQWNFTAERGEFVIRSRSRQINVSHKLRREAYLTVRSAVHGWIEVVMRKRPF
jgi:SAM-dependent methyltransferase